MTSISADISLLNTAKSALDIVEAFAKVPNASGQAYVSHVFNRGPTRRAQRSRANTAVRLASQKTGSTKEGESISIEFPFLLECEMDSRVADFHPQPQALQLDYWNRNNKRVRTGYTPDVLIEFEDGRVALVECKPFNKVQRENKLSNPRFSKCQSTQRYFDGPANDASEELGIPHVIITSEDIAHVLHANYVFLRSYLKSAATDGVRALTSHMEQVGVSTYKDLTLHPDNLWSADDVNIAITHEAIYVDKHRTRIDGMATVPVYVNKSLGDLNNKSTTDHPLLNVEDGASLSELSPKALSVALDRFSLIQPALNNPDHSLSTTQKKWLAAYKMEAASSGSGIFGLAPDFSSRGNSNRRISEEVIEILDAVVEEAAMRPNDSNHAPDLGLLRKRCKEAGLTPPSKPIFYSALAKRKAELDSITAKGGASAGYQNAPAKPVPASSHSRSSPMPWIVAMIDHTPLPIRLVQSQTRAPIDKTPWLTKMVDDSSGAVLGFFITWDRPNSDHLLAVLWDCCRRFKRLPETIALDGERPHDSISVEKVLAKSGIDKVSRRYKSPRDGSAVERSFKTMQDAVLSHLDGNYAERPNPLAWPEGWRPSNDATLTMGALWLALEKFYFETHNQEIRQQSIGNLTPYEYMIAMEQGYGAREHLSYQDLDRSSALILPFVRRKGSRTLRRESGVRIHGHSYLPTEQVTGFSYGKEYEVKYDPLDIRYALVYINGNWTRFVHRHVERFKGMDPLELAAISVELIQASKQHNSESDERAEKNADALEKIFTASPDPLAAWLEKQSTSTDSPAVANPWRESVTEVPRFDSFLEG